MTGNIQNRRRSQSWQDMFVFGVPLADAADLVALQSTLKPA